MMRIEPRINRIVPIEIARLKVGIFNSGRLRSPARKSKGEQHIVRSSEIRTCEIVAGNYLGDVAVTPLAVSKTLADSFRYLSFY